MMRNQFTMDHADESKKTKVSYTRKFLLSLRELNICKNLPSGFDESLLCEFEDASQDLQRISGELQYHGFRRSDYSSSPPIRGEFAGSNGRWDSRPIGRSNRDSNSQSERDSESGKCNGNQARKAWQAPERDGLLGKGSFIRQSGPTANAPRPRYHSNDTAQVNRKNEPYQPPRPYWAIPPARKETKDSYDDETFGSSDSKNEDRVEEERKRRESFELLRWEQQKTLQERQKSNLEVRKDGFDFSILLEDSKDEKSGQTRSKEAEEPTMLSCSTNSSLSSQSSTSRPLVPPGFARNALESKLGPKTLEKQQENQISLNERTLGSSSLHVPAADSSGISLNLSSVLVISSDRLSIDNGPEKLSGLQLLTNVAKPAETIELTSEKLDQKRTFVGSFNQELSPSLLDKLFSSTFTGGASSSVNKNDDSKAEETLNPQTVASSKFTNLFLEEEKKTVDDQSSSRPCDLFSLVQGVDNSQTPYSKATDPHYLGFPVQGSETKHLDLLSGKLPAGPPVLTCEDLEQSILSEASEKVSPTPLVWQDALDLKDDQQKADVDDRASQHLLCLLQKKTGPKDNEKGLPPNLGLDQSEKQPKQDEGLNKEEKTRNSVNSGNSLNLEALFGSAFMKDLQSVGDPVSGRPEAPVLVGPVGSNMLSKELNQRDQSNTNGFAEAFFGSDERQTRRESRVADLDGTDALDPLNLHKSMPFRGSHKQESDVPFDITKKLAALSSVARNERPIIGEQDRHFIRPPVNNFEPEILFRNSSIQGSHLNNSGIAFPSFDSPQIKSQMNLIPPGNVIHHDPPHQFPPNMNRPFRHHGGRIPDSERIPQGMHMHLRMLHQMHMQGNLPPSHLLQGFPAGSQHPLHLDNQLHGKIQETIPAQGAPFVQRQPNYMGL